MADLLSLSLCATLNVLLFHVNPLGIFFIVCKNLLLSLQHYDLFLFNFDQSFLWEVIVGGDSVTLLCKYIFNQRQIKTMLIWWYSCALQFILKPYSPSKMWGWGR